MFYDPPIIHIFEDITCDLLLMTGSPPVRVSDRVDMSMRVEPARSSRNWVKCVTQGDLGAVGYIQGLSFCKGGQSSLEIQQNIYLIYQHINIKKVVS